MSHHYVKKVAIVGATGTVGKYIVAELLETGRHEVTAITRTDSTAKVLDNVKVSTLCGGQEVLVITMEVTAPGDTEEKLVTAASEAGVSYILPNFWDADTADEQMGSDIYLGTSQRGICQRIESLGTSSWVGMITSFGYEMSLAAPWAFGLDCEERKWAFYDDGETKMQRDRKWTITHNTLPQSGKAVAGLLSLPIESSSGSSLAGYKNKLVYSASFCVSQKDMFDSVLRATKTRPEEWTIEHMDSIKCFADGKEQSKNDNVAGFRKLLYARVFFQDGSGNFEARRGLDNDALGLGREDLDEFTKVAMERIESGHTYN